MKRAGIVVHALVVLLVLLVASSGAFAAGETQSRTSQKGAYQADVTVVGGALRIGSNSVEIRLRDRSGRPLEGARLTVVPWMADTGSGVWEKPVVSDKGNGVYSADGISIVRSGTWELKLAVKHGTLEDRILFSYTVAGKEQQPAPVKPAKAKGGYSRTVKNYSIPSVTLLNQDGKRVNIKTLVDSGKPVIVNFIYTTCTTICPVLSASFTNLRKDLGPDFDKVQFISISIDPEYDRPEQMKKYLSRFTNQKGWDFLTGTREDITRVLKAFDALVPDKMAHEPIYLLKPPRSEEWVRIKGLTWSSDLMGELKSLGRI